MNINSYYEKVFVEKEMNADLLNVGYDNTTLFASGSNYIYSTTEYEDVYGYLSQRGFVMSDALVGYLPRLWLDAEKRVFYNAGTTTYNKGHYRCVFAF